MSSARARSLEGMHLPDDLARALDADPDARRSFDALAYGRRLWHVLRVEDALTPDARAQRVVTTVTTVRAGWAGR
jgi:uncharacterized protein YdeI (YjbR/CyaY-like superfamily)